MNAPSMITRARQVVMIPILGGNECNVYVNVYTCTHIYICIFVVHPNSQGD